MRAGVRVLLDLVHRSKFGVGLPEGTEFGFVSLWQMTAEQKADVAGKIADAVTKAADAGLISPEIGAKELRQASRETGVFSHIDDEFIGQLESEPPAPGDVAVDPETGQPVQAAPPGNEP